MLYRNQLPAGLFARGKEENPMCLEVSPGAEPIVRERDSAQGISVDELLSGTFASKKTDLPAANNSKVQVRALIDQ